MKSLGLVLALVAASAACAFDSEAWLVRRERFAADAARLEAAYAKYAAAALTPAENLELPVESWSNGAIRVSVAAARAQFFLADGFIWGEDVKVRQFREDGTVEALIDADSCILDRNSRCGWTGSRAFAKYGGDVTIEGTNVYFRFDERYVRIADKATIVYGEDRLTSRQVDYDSQAGVVMFERDVRLRHRERDEVFDIAAARAFAFLAGTNDLRRIVALGGVRFASGDRSGECERAVYSRATSLLKLYGAPGASARLRDEGERKGSLAGSLIRYNVDSGEVEVFDSQLSFETEGMKLPTGGKRDE